MQPAEQTLQKLLAGPVQLMIPIFQRPYDWKIKQQAKLWEDIVEQYERNLDPGKSGLPRSHFMGSLVVSPDSHPDFAKPRYLLIDGQQRLTTLTILLCAFRDTTTELGSPEQATFDRTYLKNETEEADFLLKLKPAMTSEVELRAIVDRRKVEGKTGLSKAYDFFISSIHSLRKEKADQWNPASLESAILRQLSFINITCDPSDDPHQIFESLNATGLPLSQADLIRNLLFMALGNTKKAGKVHSEVWVKAMAWMETSPARSATKWMDDFFWADLIRQGETGLTRENIYTIFDSHSKHTGRLSSPTEAEKEIRRLSALAKPYRWIIQPESFPGGSKDAKRGRDALMRLGTWGTQPALPLMLELANLRSENKITDKQFAESCEVVLSYFVRRALCGVPTNNLNRILFAAVPSAAKAGTGEQVATELRQTLSAEGAYWPTDKDLTARLPKLNFYEFGRGPQRRLVLDCLELSLAGKEPPDLSAPKISIEHIMPQTLTPDWLAVIGGTKAEATEVHRECLHKIGNLTLTGYNGELSNKPFDRKKQLLAKSTFKLSAELAGAKKWTPERIRARSKSLTKIAVSIWVGPLPGAPGISSRY
jgi:hypothetical protein